MKFLCFHHTFSTMETHSPTPTRHNCWDTQDVGTILGFLINLHGVRINVVNLPKLYFPMQARTKTCGVNRSKFDRLTVPFAEK